MGGSPISRFSNISNLIQSRPSEKELKFDLQKNILKTEITD